MISVWYIRTLSLSTEEVNMAHKRIYAEGATQKEKDHFAKFLSEDEELVIATGFGHTFLRHQFIYYLIFPGIIGLFLGIGFVYLYQYNLGYGFLLGLVLMLFLAWLKTVHLYNANRYLLTTRRVILKQGVFSVKLITTLYDKITHIEVEQSFYDRLIMHEGSVIINTAGASNDSLHLKHIDAPIEFKNLLERLINREREQYGRGSGSVVTLEGELVDD